MPDFIFERTEEGILTGRQSWVDAVTKPEKVKREKQREVWDYIRKLEESNERKSAVIVNLQEQTRKSEEKALLLQQQVEEHEREQEKFKEVAPAVENRATIEEEFRALADQWLGETGHLSDPVRIFMHPSHFKIIAMGEKALPFILKEVERMSGHWFVALDAISPVNPVSPEDAADIQIVARAWLAWGKENKLI